MQRRDVLSMQVGIEKVLKLEQPRDFDLNYALVKTKGKLRTAAEEISDMRRQFSVTARALTVEYGPKDEAGKTILLQPGQSVEYDEKIHDLDGKLRAYLDEEIAVEVHGVKRSAFENKKMTGTELEVYEFLALD